MRELRRDERLLVGVAGYPRAIVQGRVRPIDNRPQVDNLPHTAIAHNAVLPLRVVAKPTVYTVHLVMVKIGVLCLWLGLACCLTSSCTSTPSKREEPVSSTGVQQPSTSQAFGTFSVNPNSGRGRDQLFTLRLERNGAAPPPVLIGFLVNARRDGGHACYALHNPETQKTLLVNDSGKGSMELDPHGEIGNNQCEVLSDGTKSTISASQIITTLHIRFRDSFAGRKMLYAIAQDGKGLGSGLEHLGQYLVE